MINLKFKNPLKNINFSNEDQTARNICDKLSKVMAYEERGEEIAIRSAQDIVTGFRRDGRNKLADELEKHLLEHYEKVRWSFGPTGKQAIDSRYTQLVRN